MHTVVEFHYHTVTTVNAESVGSSTPGVRVTWNTTLPPECVTSVRVELRLSSHGPVVASNRTTNTSSHTEVIQTGLQCATFYYTRVIVTGGPGGAQMLSPRHSDVQVLVGGKELFACDCKQPDGGYTIAQIYQPHLEWELKSLQTTQVSEFHGSGHLRVCPCVLT